MDESSAKELAAIRRLLAVIAMLLAALVVSPLYRPQPVEAQAERTRWEYTKYQATIGTTAEMNILGNEGWELVGFNGAVHYFKRPRK